MYTFLKDCEIVECFNLLEVATHFKIEIKNNGTVYFNGKKDKISYNMEEYTKEEVLKDFVKTRLRNFVMIYKSERL